MKGFDRILWMGAVGLMAVVGLFVASRGAHNPVSYWGGLGFFVFAVLFVFYQIKTYFDHRNHNGDSGVH